jgi:hypothetical protein
MFLVRVRQIGARMDELGVLPLEQAQRFSVELQRSALHVNGGDPLEQLLVQSDRIQVCGNLRRQRCLGFLQHWIGVRLIHPVECRRSTRQQATAAFHGDEGVLEGWGCRVVRNFIDLRELLRHARFNGRLIIRVLDFVERRRAKGQRACRIKRIGRPEIGRFCAAAGNARQQAEDRERSNFVFQVFRPKEKGSRRLYVSPGRPWSSAGCLQAA